MPNDAVLCGQWRGLVVAASFDEAEWQAVVGLRGVFNFRGMFGGYSGTPLHVTIEGHLTHRDKEKIAPSYCRVLSQD